MFSRIVILYSFGVSEPCLLLLLLLLLHRAVVVVVVFCSFFVCFLFCVESIPIQLFSGAHVHVSKFT